MVPTGSAGEVFRWWGDGPHVVGWLLEGSSVLKCLLIVLLSHLVFSNSFLNPEGVIYYLFDNLKNTDILHG